jgi:hypothetical protein
VGLSWPRKSPEVQPGRGRLPSHLQRSAGAPGSAKPTHSMRPTSMSRFTRVADVNVGMVLGADTAELDDLIETILLPALEGTALET